MPRPAVFFDRDNTLILAHDYLGDPEQVELMPGAADCVAAAQELGYAVVVVSNQSGVARGKHTEQDVHRVDARLAELLLEANPNAKLDRQDFCPHHPDFGVDCDCRKPRAGMLRRSAAALEVDLSRSWLVGDAPRDIEAGAAAGCRTVLLDADVHQRSPAADEPEAVRPDFVARSLDEVTRVLKREARPAGPSRTEVGAATDAILADLRRQREDPGEEFNVRRLLAAATQVLALGAFVVAVIEGGSEPLFNTAALFLQLLTLTLLAGVR
jgi:D-glycero-D-manno-heptose 1,7-bisphosphate phosphatase